MHLKVTREKEQEGQEDGSLRKSTCCQTSCSESEIHTVEGENWFSQVVLGPPQEWHDMYLSPYTTHTQTQMKSINVHSEVKNGPLTKMHLASHASLSTPPHTVWTKQFLKFPCTDSRGSFYNNENKQLLWNLVTGTLFFFQPQLSSDFLTQLLDSQISQ